MPRMALAGRVGSVVVAHILAADCQLAATATIARFLAALAAVAAVSIPSGVAPNRTESAEDVLRRLHQQTGADNCRGLGNAPLRVRVAGLALARTQAQEGAG